MPAARAGCWDVPRCLHPSSPPACSAHYLLDFCHIPDKHLVINEIQELLQLAQVRDKTFPDFLREGIKSRMFHLWDISPRPQVHFPPRDATALLGSGRRDTLDRRGRVPHGKLTFLYQGAKRYREKGELQKCKPALSSQKSFRGRVFARVPGPPGSWRN